MVRRVEVVSMDMVKATVLATGKLTCRKVDWVVFGNSCICGGLSLSKQGQGGLSPQNMRFCSCSGGFGCVLGGGTGVGFGCDGFR